MSVTHRHVRVPNCSIFPWAGWHHSGKFGHTPFRSVTYFARQVWCSWYCYQVIVIVWQIYVNCFIHVFCWESGQCDFAIWFIAWGWQFCSRLVLTEGTAVVIRCWCVSECAFSCVSQGGAHGSAYGRLLTWVGLLMYGYTEHLIDQLLMWAYLLITGVW